MPEAILTTETVKRFARAAGAELVGVAAADRLDGAPAGHTARDILPGARSVVVCARAIPAGVFRGPATSYQRVMDVAHQELDLLAARLAVLLESEGGKAVPVPSDEPYQHWEAERSYGRGDLSHKHAAEAAGLGRMGRNSILITPEFGNRVHLVSVVTDVQLAPDPMMDRDLCPEGCALCVRACPVGAIGVRGEVNQALCRPALLRRLPKGRVVEACWACRQACPAGSPGR